MKKKFLRKTHNIVLEIITVIMAAVFSSTMFALSTGSITLAVMFIISMLWLLFFSYANMFWEGGTR